MVTDENIKVSYSFYSFMDQIMINERYVFIITMSTGLTQINAILQKVDKDEASEYFKISNKSLFTSGKHRSLRIKLRIRSLDLIKV